ncbi:MAG: Gfo/Idh/MocA family oxidoreductase [Tannerellaceae bacterium]|jgi:predicted dehydrogenase|nr:Gfo/Idh/MocA family oxidoreductase [Tannerellaceae bacterium]
MNRKQFISQLGTIGAAALAAPVTGNTSLLAAASSQAQMPVVGNGGKIRVGVIGCGSVSGMYLPHLATCPYAEVVSLCDRIPERAQEAARKYNVKNWYPHIDKMLAGVAFDLFVNLTDMQEHGRLNRQALIAKRHVWSEKPMANTYAEGRELYELAKKQGVRFWGAPAVVNSPQFAFMAKQINENKLGRIAAAHAHYGHQGPDWSAFFFEEGGGSLPDLGVYNISTLTGLVGPVKSLVAITTIVNPTRNTGNKGYIRVVAEDNAMLVMEHQNNVLSHIQCGFNYFDPYGHEGTGQERPTLSVVGSAGNMHMVGYDWKPSGVDMATTDDEKTHRYATGKGTFVWEEGASVICQCLATGKEPLINAEHALHVLEIIEAARLSQAQGKRISLKSSFKWPVIAL